MKHWFLTMSHMIIFLHSMKTGVQDDCYGNGLLRADESDTKEEEEKEDEQEADVSLMEKQSASQIREPVNSLFNFALITGNVEMQHVASYCSIKASKTAEMDLTQITQRNYTTSYFV